jgi:hypothetical protein
MALSAHHGRRIRQGAAMAAIVLNAAHRNGQARKPLQPRRAAVAREGGRASIPPADQGTTATTPFRPIDPDIVSEAIPAFFIGRNRAGFWVARDVNGRIGGLFLRESSALAFARMHSGAAGCATVYPSERFELDLKNDGNPWAVQLAPLIAFARHPREQLKAIVGRMMEAIRRWTKAF